METFKANISELEQSSSDMNKASEELNTLFEEYAKAFMAKAGVAYEEGTDIYNALKAKVDQAVAKAVEQVEALATHGQKAATTAQRVEESEGNSVSHINSTINL